MYRLLSVLSLLILLLGVSGRINAQPGWLERGPVSKADSLRIVQKLQLAMDTSGLDIETGHRYFNEALDMARASGSKYLYADILLQEAVQFFQEAKYEASIGGLIESIRFFDDAGARLKEARCYANLGLVYQYVGKYSEGLKSLFSGLRVAQGQAGSEDVIGSFYSNISLAYKSLGDFDNALTYAMKAAKNNLDAKDTVDLAKNYNTIGEIYKEKEKLDKSIDYFKKAVVMHRLVGSESNAISSTSNLANVYLDKNELDSALYYKSQTIAYAIAHKKTEFAYYCNTITAYGYMLAASGRIKEAKEYVQGCLSCRPLLPDYGFAINYYSFLYQYYKIIGRNDLALENLERLKDVKDTVNVASRKFENQRIAIRYEFDTKAKEDSLTYQLRISKQEIATATYKNRMYLLLVALLVISGGAVAIIRYLRKIQNEKRMRELETMRTSIASDLHDDIGSTLSSIQIISSMALQQCDSNQLLKQSVNQISELSDKVSDGIREIVWSVNPAHDKLSSIIDMMRKLAAEVLGPNDIGFKFTQNIKDGERQLTPQQRKDLLMIFKEALNNARKYSGTRQVDITVIQDGATLRLQIKDYGNGFDMEKVLKGNGLNNMKRRAEAIQAEFSVHSRPGNGTFLCLKLPLP